MPDARPGLTPLLREKIDGIAGVVGSWCPALSPDGRQVAYVTDRSGLPRLEVVHLDPTGDDVDRPPRQVSRPDQEVISVAWSPDGRWLTYLVSPNGFIRAELHAVRPDGSDHRALAGLAERETVFAGSWTSLPSTYAFSLADGVSPDADVCFVDVETGAVRGWRPAVSCWSPASRRTRAGSSPGAARGATGTWSWPTCPPTPARAPTATHRSHRPDACCTPTSPPGPTRPRTVASPPTARRCTCGSAPAGNTPPGPGPARPGRHARPPAGSRGAGRRRPGRLRGARPGGAG